MLLQRGLCVSLQNCVMLGGGTTPPGKKVMRLSRARLSCSEETHYSMCSMHRVLSTSKSTKPGSHF